jgi:8-oxo-dGTP pyrophosphatase MutT (NUDIX family)
MVSLPENIRTVALVHIQFRQLMLVRPRGKAAFYMPGGKLEEGETDFEALIREINEETHLILEPATIRFRRTYTAPAYGLPTAQVEIACYSAHVHGKPVPGSEIVDIGFFRSGTYLELKDVAPAVVEIIKDLVASDEID